METNKTLQQDTGVDLKKLLQQAIAKWYLFVASILISLALAVVVNRYTVPLYEVQSAVMINRPSENGASAAALLYGSEVFQGAKSLTNEIVLLKTKFLALQTLKKLDFGVSYYQQGNVKLTEVYQALSPVQVLVDTTSNNVPYGLLFQVNFLGGSTYALSSENQAWNNLLAGKEYLSGREYIINGFRFALLIKEENAAAIQNEVLFSINKLEDLAGQYAATLDVSIYPGGASALVLKLGGPTPQKDRDFLDAHMLTYRENNLEIKNTNATNTLQFIDDQLLQISDSLYFIESRIEAFQKKNETMNISSEGGRVAAELKGLENEKATLLMNLKYIAYLRNYLQNGKELDEVVVPAVMGVTDPILRELVAQLVAKQTEIKLLSQNENIRNPLLTNQLKVYRQELAEIRNNLMESLSSVVATQNIALDELSNQIKAASGALQKLPFAERQLINMQRLYGLSENLYVMLMEKRAEAGIAKAASAPDVTILSEAYVSSQTAPNTSKNFLVALLLGLALPLAFVFAKDFFNNKVSTVEDLTRLTTLPLLGMVGHNKKEGFNLINQNSRSALAEAFRTVRSNLRFMVGAGEQGKIFVITSSVSGEGKTFSAKNLAYIFAISGERTLLVNADMRKPNNNLDFGVNSSLGLSNFLAGYVALEDVVHPTIQENLHILPSGDIPPNPSELLLNKRMEGLVQELRQRYDYIIMDTPPVGILSDGLELMHIADANIFMVRHDYTLKSFVSNIQQQHEAGKIRNTAILFNDVDYNKLNNGYGYGYGYGYYAEDQEQEKKWWRRAPMLND